MQTIADARGVSMAQVALAWVTHRPAVTSTILGARTLAQLDDNLGVGRTCGWTPTKSKPWTPQAGCRSATTPTASWAWSNEQRRLAGGRATDAVADA